MSDEEKDLVDDRDDLALEDEPLPQESHRPGRRTPRLPALLPDGRAVWRVKVLFSSATEYCDAPPGMELSAGHRSSCPRATGTSWARSSAPRPTP